MLPVVLELPNPRALGPTHNLLLPASYGTRIPGYFRVGHLPRGNWGILRRSVELCV